MQKGMTMKLRMCNKYSEELGDFTNHLQVWTDWGWVDVPIIDIMSGCERPTELGDKYLEVFELESKSK